MQLRSVRGKDLAALPCPAKLAAHVSEFNRPRTSPCFSVPRQPIFRPGQKKRALLGSEAVTAITTSHQQKKGPSAFEVLQQPAQRSSSLKAQALAQLHVLLGAASSALQQLTAFLSRGQAGCSRDGSAAVEGWRVHLASAPLLLGSTWGELNSNSVLVAGFWGWFVAQSLKIFTKRYKFGVWDAKAVFDSGGMPSSHSALCMAVTTALGLEFGLQSPLFAVSLCFSLIVMYDAAGVRRHAGKQAEVLNVVLSDLLHGHPASANKLKEVLGHTPLQVICGACLGILVGALFPGPPTTAIIATATV